MAQNGKTNGASRVGAGKVPAKPCATCGKPAVKKYRPFCSLRCANLDLANWLDQRYVLPGSDSGPRGGGGMDDDGGGE